MSHFDEMSHNIFDPLSNCEVVIVDTLSEAFEAIRGKVAERYSRGCGNCGRSQILGFAGRSSNLPECILCDKTTPSMWIKRSHCNTCAYTPEDNTDALTCITCVKGSKWLAKLREEKKMLDDALEKKCGTCFNFPGNTNLKRQHCRACEFTPSKPPSQWAPKSNKGEKKVELDLNKVTTIVAVQFPSSSREYSFKTNLNLNVGDQVVVDTSNNGAAIAVVSSTDGNYGKATRWVIQKIDMKEHRERIVKEAKLLALREKLEVRRSQIEDINVYEQYAKHDPKMFELWNEYVTLQGDK